MNMHFKALCVVSALCIFALVSAAPASAEVSCKEWNTNSFFSEAGVADVSRCIGAGADVNARDNDGWTALHYAARDTKNSSVITALLKAGADVNAKDTDGNTPLHFAARNNENPAVIMTLLNAGAEINARNKDGRTPLHKAARENDNLAVITALLKAGADVNARDGYKYTPLHSAARSNKNPAVISTLVKAGAEVDARNGVRNTPLHLVQRAPFRNNPAVITALLAVGANPNVRGYYEGHEKTPLEIAREENEPAYLAAFSAETVAAFREKERKAQAAARKREIERRLLAERVSCGKWNTATFFKHAAEADVSRCLEGGAKPNARNKYDETPLHMAAKFSKTHVVVSSLKKAGADLKARDKKGRTPLHTAAVFSKTPAVVTALIQAGADLNAKDKRGRTPLEFAGKFSSSPAIVAVLKKATPPAKTKIPSERKKNNRQARATRVSCEKWNTPAFFRRASEADVSRCLKTKKAGARNKYGRTPLHYAAQGETAAIATALVKAGANPNTRDERGGWTPLHLAAQTGKTPAVVTALIQAGADPGAKDKKGRTPLQLAQKFNKTPTVVNALKQAKAVSRPSPKATARVSCEKWNTPAFFKSAELADLARCLQVKNPNAMNKIGRTPLHYAAQGEAPELVAALVKAGAKPNAPDKRGGWTPLHLAAWFSKKPAVVAALLAAGADPAARDKKGKTPWDYAEQNAALKDTAPFWRLNEERFR